jgi:type IV secretory pathway TraG/TraD family ATPase VirD4
VLKADGDPGHMEARRFATTVLEGLWRNDQRTVSSVYATARTMVWPWIDPLVARSTASCTINIDWLLKKNNTLHVCIPLSDQHRLRPVLGELLNDLVGQAFERFVRTNKPLEPPLLLVIDEAATLRPDQLPSWAALSGFGVRLVTAWRSIAQIEAAYGRQSQAILTNHLTKLSFPGMSDAAGLDYLSRLLGDETRAVAARPPARRRCAPLAHHERASPVTGRPAPDELRRRPARAWQPATGTCPDPAVVPRPATSRASIAMPWVPYGTQRAVPAPWPQMPPELPPGDRGY